MGVIAEQTGPLSFVGLANANVARMVIGDINASALNETGIEMLKDYVEHGGTAESTASILAAPALFPDGARTQLRQNFFDVVSVFRRGIPVKTQPWEGAAPCAQEGRAVRAAGHRENKFVILAIA